jgi:tripartite-type tricarboxylate transporter receptor subunit TctC
MRKFGLIVGICAIVVAAAAASAAAWEPKKPIRILVGFAAGGGTDVVARSLASAAQEFFLVPLVIVNKAGASGTIAADQVATSAADGYTLLVAGGSESTSVPNHQKVTYTLESFRPVIRATRSRNILVVGTKSPYRTLEEFVKAAKAAPGKMSYGSAGAGSLAHSTFLVFGRAAGLDMRHVPFKGGAPTMAALLGGHIDIAMAAPDEAKPHVDAGTMRMLALSSLDRFAPWKDVPTLKELGYDVYIENMKGLVAPAGLPDDVYAYLHDNFKKALESDTWKSLAANAQLETGYLDGPAFQKAMQDMSAAIARALK